jgi:osmotically-inducible protein OsmY
MAFIVNIYIWKNSSFLIGFFLLVNLLVSGCAPLMVGSAATTVATTATEERTVSGIWDDSKIKTQIIWHYSKHKNDLAGRVDVVVRQGRVLLTGTVDTPQQKIKAVKLAWKVPGVREVMDEISLNKEETLSGYAQDSWVTTQVKSALLFAKDVHSSNYSIQTINGVVYLMGVAASKKELNAALYHVRRVAGVKEVVNFVQLPQKPQKKERKV